MWLYRLGVLLYHLAIRLTAQLGNTKAQKWVEGRREWTNLPPGQLPFFLKDRRPEQPLLWMHTSSLGEFEQGRPVLELLRSSLPDYFILLTFYSPSGYEKSLGYQGADAIQYLPADGPGRAQRWVHTIRPDIAIFVKYDFWLYHLWALRSAQVDIFLIAGSFRPDQPFFRWYGGPWRKALSGFKRLIVQTEADALQLSTIYYPKSKIKIGGDPRADRVIQLANAPFYDEVLTRFCVDTKVLFAGSVWPADVALLSAVWPLFPEDWKLVLAPHQLREEEINRWSAEWSALRYSEAATEALADHRVMILDTIGVLSRAYRYGKIAYVGGGFGEGIHNTLEPMAYGLPVVFGPRFQKFPEAVITSQGGGSFPVATEAAARAAFRQLLHQPAYEAASAYIQQFTQSVAGSAERTFAAILAAASNVEEDSPN